MLKPGKEIQRRLVMLENMEEFDELVNQIRDQGPPPDGVNLDLDLDKLDLWLEVGLRR